MKFTMANAVKQIQGNQAFEGEYTLLAAMARKQSKKKSKGGFIISPEMMKSILLVESITAYTRNGMLSPNDLRRLVDEWEQQAKFIHTQDQRVASLEKSLRWYKQRHKGKK